MGSAHPIRQSHWLRLALQGASLVVWEVDVEAGTIVYFGERETLLLLGFPEGEQPLLIRNRISHMHPEDRERVGALIERTFNTAVPYKADYRVIVDGETRWVAARGISGEDETGRRKLFGVSFDMTDTVKAQQALEHLAMSDELTGLDNRRSFFSSSNRSLELAKRQGQRAALVYLDLDRFKELNDSQGHEAGDEALKLFAGVLRKVFRSSDLIARVGGDEFCILQISAEPAPEVSMDRLRQHLQSAGAKASRLSFSYGIAMFNPADTVDLDRLLRQADRSMYEHKRSTRSMPSSR